MGRGLVGHYVRYDAAPHHLGIDLGSIADQPDREWLTLIDGFSYLVQRFV